MRRAAVGLVIAVVVALLTIAGAALLNVEAPAAVAAVVGVVAAAAYLATPWARSSPASRDGGEDAAGGE